MPVTALTTYPSAVDYTLALQNPGTAFADASLRTASFTQGLMGPYGIAGSSAVVFHATIASQDYALRCYTRQDASTPERYAQLDSFVSAKALSKYVGIVTWYKEQVQVKGSRWPVLKMGWIAGQQLNEYVGYLADTRNSDALSTLAQSWRALVGELQGTGFAHGDLQHGNILVDQQGQLRLVDFDSVWIPTLAGQAAPTETGHPSYQPRGGTAQTRWGPYMDSFSALVIYLALTALSRDPGLWAKFNNGDNLLFERDDFSPTLERDIWKELAALGDADVDKIAGKLRDCCAPGWVASKSLEDTLKTSWWDQPNLVTSPAPAKPAPAAQPETPPAWVASPSGTISVPGQAPPAGSLPPPPKTPYQSKVAPQATGAAAGSGPNPGAPWFAQQASKPPRTETPGKPPQPTTPKQPANAGGSGKTAFGGLLVIAAIILFTVLAAHHHAGEGALWGVIVFVAGVAVAGSKPKNPPGNPPPGGAAQ